MYLVSTYHMIPGTWHGRKRQSAKHVERCLSRVRVQKDSFHPNTRSPNFAPSRSGVGSRKRRHSLRQPNCELLPSSLRTKEPSSRLCTLDSGLCVCVREKNPLASHQPPPHPEVFFIPIRLRHHGAKQASCCCGEGNSGCHRKWKIY